MLYCPLSSGSKGNCHFIASREARLLLDAGTTARHIQTQLQALGTAAKELDGVLITHEHIDHVAALRVLKNMAGVPFYCNEKTARQLLRCEAFTPDDFRIFTTGTPFALKDMVITAFPVSHDAAEPVGFTLCEGTAKIAAATDVGHLSATLLEHLRNAQLVILEANHDVEMLMAGPYPEMLKRRILGAEGHLSNTGCGQALGQLLEGCLRQVVLAHLSEENNTPALAYATVYGELEELCPGIKTQLPVDIAYQSVRGACYLVS